MELKKVPTGKLIVHSCLGILAGVTIVPGLALGNLLYNHALNRKYDRINFNNQPSEDSETVPQECPAQNVFVQDSDSEWAEIFETRKEREITSYDGLTLRAYQLGDNSAKRQVIMVHGYGGDHLMYRQLAKHFYKTGFSILMPDLRGHGKSEGNVICMGWKDRLDIIKWIDLLVSENPRCEIVLYGISMGAATVMMTSGEKLPDNVKAIIEDCGYTSAAEQFGYCMKTFFNIVPFPILQYSNLVCRIRGGWGFWQASAVKQLNKNYLPMLFIHGADDDFVPAFMIDKVYAATMGPKEKLIVPGAKHAEACCVDPEGYGRAVEGFLKKYID
ncbi:MAG TPA: alpha/beta hydrolase [Oscillospiraceae bacterium]|nr:alpha/beta hydrolase [Oscillospiraceae bacterium]HPK35887.1 alpha/beta hydrolase [Oscillospiraceae bacterium]HPR76364.1 alpha/beta hydrolase [Oscillospiraceae bacterium]